MATKYQKRLIYFFLFIFGGSLFANDQEKFEERVHQGVLEKIEKIKSQSVAELTKELLEKEKKLNAKEKELVKKEDQLNILAKEIEEKIQSFDQKKQAILGCIDRNQEEMKQRVLGQVEIISNMKPEKAAQLLTVQDSDIAVRILQSIEPKRASRIFNFMDKEVSARLQKQYLNMKK